MTLLELIAGKKRLNEERDIRPYQEIRHHKTLINMQISKSIAEACGIFIMSLLAIPMGMKSRRSDHALNIVLALSLCFCYYFVMVIFSWFGDCTRWRPDILIWIPNIVLAYIGIRLFRHAAKN